MKEIEVWLQTFAAESRTPIHRHSYEEVFVVLKGQGTLYLAPSSHSKYPGNLQESHISPNSTFHIPVNDVHQFSDSDYVDETDDRSTSHCWSYHEVYIVHACPGCYLTEICVLALVFYNDWSMPHTASKLKFPYYWDEECYQTTTRKDEL
ncbi:hypothetical protein RND71_006972 [Anisodus tanguticus]|uniref:Uncharacterized protein n=1 Tax=Anisodus tanguticus TaxID=243964 RepID=A0AAE1SV07_9SOLA|nr:hypothetical protein RND71_006972 [Anisodus tanguticus]